ncbi:HAD family phosphatase [uncultured Roseibium sp.]|uniref:HAD family hydrolase n=1 Tax=uncultured Roseibium sp. TaxID=1936171 RepID=UPI002609882D|nr:HAD family phosphatase [uncultured Roseibium sp.]
MPDIRFVVFDMDQVLYDYDHQTRLKLLEQLTGRAAAEIDRAVWGGPQEAAAEAGSPDTPEGYLAQYAELLGYPIDFGTWADIRRKMMRARPDVLELVRRLKPGADLALLTNNGMMLKAALPTCAPEVVEIFGEKAHVSAEFKARKPDPSVYLRLCKKYGYAPEESAFIDDNPANVAGAVEAGMAGHVYTTVDELLGFLGRHNLV